MLGWIEEDAEGRSFLMRSGTGRIVAVLPVSSESQDADLPFHTVVIEVDLIPGRPRSVRLSIRARVHEHDPIHRLAEAGLTEGFPQDWSIAWHRHPWVPDSVLITSLDIQSDTQAWLLSLERSSRNLRDSGRLHSTGGMEHE